MAFIEGREMFQSIKNSTRFCLLLPEEGVDAAKAVLYLLPVRRGLATDWVRYTNVERLAREMNLAVVMPEGVSSDFCNMVYGMKWWDYLTEELPMYLKEVFGLTGKRRFCFGAEMGALGSIKLALRCPEQWSGAVAVDADFLRISRFSAGEIADHDMESIYGEAPVTDEILSQYDPIRLAANRSADSCALFLSRDDPGAQDIAGLCGHPVCWSDTAGHDWDAYDAYLKEFLKKVIDKENRHESIHL